MLKYIVCCRNQMMIGSQLNCSAISVVGALTDQSICLSPFSSSHCYSSRKLVSIQLFNSWKGRCIGKPSGRLKYAAVTSCMSSFGRFSGEPDRSGEGRNREDDDADYLEAIILIAGYYCLDSFLLFSRFVNINVSVCVMIMLKQS